MILGWAYALTPPPTPPLGTGDEEKKISPSDVLRRTQFDKAHNPKRKVVKALARCRDLSSQERAGKRLVKGFSRGVCPSGPLRLLNHAEVQ